MTKTKIEPKTLVPLPIFRRIADEVQRRLKQPQFLSLPEQDEAFRLIVQGQEFALTSLPVENCIVSKFNDLCVGFRSRQKVHFVIETFRVMNNVIIGDYQMEPNQFVYCFQNRWILPVVGLDSNLKIKMIDGSIDQIECIGALLSANLRNQLTTGGIFERSTYCWHDGYLWTYELSNSPNIGSSIPTDLTNLIPDVSL